jgi:hypothetical protein
MAFSHVPLLAIPFAGYLAILGFKIPPKEKMAKEVSETKEKKTDDLFDDI